jgi:hypothetical protein
VCQALTAQQSALYSIFKILLFFRLIWTCTKFAFDNIYEFIFTKNLPFRIACFSVTNQFNQFLAVKTNMKIFVIKNEIGFDKLFNKEVT